MTPKVTKPYYVYSGDMAEEQYATCIRKLVEIITESYRVSSFPYHEDIFKNNHLYQTHITVKCIFHVRIFAKRKSKRSCLIRKDEKMIRIILKRQIKRNIASFLKR